MKAKLSGKWFYAAAFAAIALLYFCVFLMYSFFGEENRRKELNAALTSISAFIESEFIHKMEDAAKRVAGNESITFAASAPSPENNKKALDYMETIRDYIGADIVYLMDQAGGVVISTSHKGYDLTGNNYAFRPYFKNAVGGSPDIYAAIGVTTFKSGYYFSAPVRPGNGAIKAVVVIKAGLGEIQKIMQSYDIQIALVSPEGIVFQSNTKSWHLKSVMPVEDERLEALIKSRQFGEGPFDPLGGAVKFGSGRQKFDNMACYIEQKPFSIKGWKIIACENAEIKYSVSDFENIILISITAVMTFIVLAAILLAYDRRNKEKLLESERAYREIFDSINDAIYIHDIGDFRLVDVNRKTCELLEMEREEILNTLPPDTGNPDYSPDKAFEFMKKAAEGSPQVFEWQAVTGGGRKIMVEVSLKRAVIGGCERIIAVVRDIGERIEARDMIAKAIKDLKRSNEELESFAYVTSHDLKEPLRMVSGYLQLLERRYADRLDDNAKEFIKYAVEGASNMNDLINGLLSLSRISTKASDFERVDLNHVFEKVRTALKFGVDEAGAQISAAGLPVVNADPLQIKQLLQNLCANALKFRSKERPLTVEIGSEKEGNMTKLWVKDNGIGIAKEYSERIFVVFQRLHSRVEYPGTGIGLAICKKIVERHGGKIWVESEPGKGSVFYFTLPSA